MNLGPKGEYNFITCLHHVTLLVFY